MKEETKLKKFGRYLLTAIGILVVALLVKYLMQGGLPSSQSSYNEPPYGYDSPRSGNSAAGVFYDNTENAPSPMVAERSAADAAKSAPLSGGGVANGTNSTAPASDRKVIRTGDLKLLVAKAEATSEQIKTIANTLGGFVDNVYIYDVTDASKAGSVTIKVPADKFDNAVKEIKKLAIKVENEKVSASDVTEAWVDLQARLKSLQAEEAQYLEIMKDAKKVEDVLKVTENLSSVRSDIERLQSKIKYLSGQVELSSITVSLEEDADVQVFGLRWRPLIVLKQALRNMLNGLTGYADAIIGFIFILPTLILWIVTGIAVLWVVRKIYRFVKTKFFV